MSRPRIVVLAAVVAVVIAAVAVIVAVRSPEERSSATTTTPMETAPVSGPPTAPSPLPSAVAGLELAPVEFSTYRVSLVFRLRNTILNGLPAASDYTLKTLQAKRGEESGLLLGVALLPGASAPPVGRSIRGLIGTPATVTKRIEGHLVTIHRVPGYSLAFLDIGPRRRIIGIASNQATARFIVAAVAKPDA